MVYLKVILGIKTFQSFLTYSHEISLPTGQIVLVPIRNKLEMGIVIGEYEDDNLGFDKAKVKAISEVYPVKFNTERYNFLLSFSQNTFNSINAVLGAFLQPYKYLTQKQLKLLQIANKDTNLSNSLNSPSLEVNLILEQAILLRIIYIIRNNFNNKAINNVLIIFPEKKYLEKILELYNNLRINDTSYDDLPQIIVYYGEKSKASSELVFNLLSESVNFVFSLRAGIFLPFKKLDTIVLIDESNGFYLQDQNSIYYDTRDASFFLAKSFGSTLNYVSTLPSTRLAGQYQPTILVRK